MKYEVGRKPVVAGGRRLDVVSGDRQPIHYAYAVAYIAFGWFGTGYLRRSRETYT